MNVPGFAPDPLSDPAVLDRADGIAQKLLEDLKKNLRVETRDAGTLRKAMTITIPAAVVADHLNHNFDELRADVVLPGFRKGRAPMKLVRKRFDADVRSSMKSVLVGQSFLAAVENEKLEVLGDPLFQIDTPKGPRFAEMNEALAQLAIPEDGDFSYICEVELRPEFELPSLSGIEVKNPRIEITDKDVEGTIERQLKIRGKYAPCDDGAGEPDDQVIVDVALHVDGKEVKREDNVQLGVRPARLDGIPVMDLAEVLRGAKPGVSVTARATIPDDYERPDLRGKPAEFHMVVHEVKRLVPLTRGELVEQLGFANEQELRDDVKAELESERDRLVRSAQKQQILQTLLDQTPMDLPEQLSARQTDRAVMRKVIELRMAGTPESEVEARVDELRTGARDEVARDLKIAFLLDKVADKLKVRVTDEEISAEIARIARRYGQRFDRVRDDLHARGLLYQLAEQIRQDKCLEEILKSARLVDVTRESEGT